MVTATESSGSGKSGGKFDEAKVKRDGHGQFAKKEGRGQKKWADLLDKSWSEHKEDVKQILLNQNRDKLLATAKDFLKSSGVSKDDVQKKMATDKKFFNDYNNVLVDVMNEASKKNGVSPSGEQRLEFSYDKKTADLKAEIVPYNGPNPHPGLTEKFKQQYQQTQVQNAQFEKSDEESGGLFNPDATLDTSRVSDVNDPTGWLDWLKKLQHVDTSESLSHYGVKGMKWGVRKDRSGSIRARATLGLRDRRAEKWRLTADTKAYGKVYRRSARQIRVKTREINNRPEFKDKDFRTDSPLRRRYYDAYSKMVTDELNSNVTSRSRVLPTRRLGMSPNKRLELKFHYDLGDEARPRVTIRRADTRTGRAETRKAIKHADINLDEELEVFLITDDKGYITDLDAPTDEDLAHEDEEDIFLEHYGIKGMRWGVRRTQAQLDAATPSEDAVKAAVTKEKISRGGTSAASNAELQQLIARTDLERRLSQLTPPPPESATKKFIKSLASDIARTEITRVSKGAVAIAVERELAGKNVKLNRKFAKQVSERIAPKVSKPKKPKK